MTIITIVSKYGQLAIYHKRLKGSRIYWRAPNFEVWCLGQYPPIVYEQAMMLAVHHAGLAGLEPYQVKRAHEVYHPKPIDTKTRRMF